MALVLLTACQRENPPQVGYDYLEAIERGDYKKAYSLIDQISQNYTPYDKFVEYWKNYDAKYGHPYKHVIQEVARDTGGIIHIDYIWYHKKPQDTTFWEETRAYRLKLTRDLRGWRVKFLKYRRVYKEKK